MPFLGLLLLVGLVATGFALTRKSEAAQLPPGQVGRFLGQLRKGQLYRVWVRIPSGAITQADLQSRVEHMGFGDTKLVTPDPTDRSVATIITRWMLDSSEVFDTPEVRLFQLEAVQEPPANVKTSGEQQGSTTHLCLDGGLTSQEVEAIRWALMSDDDAKHLGGFASTFEPDFPIAASLLRAKASLANSRSMGSVLAGQLRDKNVKMVERFTRAAAAVGVGSGAAQWVDRLASNTIGTLKRLTANLVPPETWEKYQSAVSALGPFIPAHRMWMSDKAFSTLKQVSEAPRDIGEDGEEFAKHLCTICPALALVPGLGAGIACMRAVGAALAVATPLDAVNMQDVATCLEGESEATAFLTAAHLVGDFARGKPAPADGLFKTLTREREAMTDKEKVAFDAGVALGFARALQATDFPSLWSYVAGDTLASRALAFAVAVGKAKREKLRTVSVLLGKIASDLPPGSLDAVRNLSVDLVANDKLLSLYPSELASKKDVPVSVAAAALAVVREIGEGIRIVDPTALRLICPGEVTFQLGLTSSALKLAMSMTKPYVSQVVDPAGIVPKVKAIAKSDAPEGAKARQQLERAVKALERQRWADWYRKVQAQRGSQGNISGVGASPASGQLTRSA
jgi:hypothetical protein